MDIERISFDRTAIIVSGFLWPQENLRFPTEGDHELTFSATLLESLEPNLPCEAVADSGFEHGLLSGGDFAGHLGRVSLPKCRLDRGRDTLRCFTRGAAPDGGIVPCTTDGKNQAAYVNDQDTPCEHVQIDGEATTTPGLNPAPR
jgi:hypothetical protein